jgi:hypothetical protein
MGTPFRFLAIFFRDALVGGGVTRRRPWGPNDTSNSFQRS